MPKFINDLDMNGNGINNCPTIDNKSNVDHTHNYAASFEPGGSATSAVKLETTRKINGIEFDGTEDISNYASTNGSSTAYTCTIANITSYSDGLEVTILPHIDCGASPKLNINNLGALSIKNSSGELLKAGDIKANIPLSLVRVGSYFFIRGGSGGGDSNTSLNLFVQTTTPSAKDGLWIKSSSAKVENIIHKSSISDEGSVVNLDFTADGTIIFCEYYNGYIVCVEYDKGIYKYDINTHTMTKLCASSYIDDYKSFFIRQGYLYGIISGITSGSDPLGKYVYRLSLATYSCTLYNSSCPQTFNGGSIAYNSVSGYAYIFPEVYTGNYLGSSQGYELLHLAYRYNVSSNTFTSISSMPDYYPQKAILVGNLIYLLSCRYNKYSNYSTTYDTYIYNIASDTYVNLGYTCSEVNSTCYTSGSFQTYAFLYNKKIYMSVYKYKKILDTVDNTTTTMDTTLANNLGTFIYYGGMTVIDSDVYLMYKKKKYSFVTKINPNTVVIYNTVNPIITKMIKTFGFFDTTYKIGNGTYVTDSNGNKITCNIYVGDGTTWNLLS